MSRISFFCAGLPIAKPLPFARARSRQCSVVTFDRSTSMGCGPHVSNQRARHRWRHMFAVPVRCTARQAPLLHQTVRLGLRGLGNYPAALRQWPNGIYVSGRGTHRSASYPMGGGGWRFSRLNLPITPGFSAGPLGSARRVRTPDCATPCQARSLFTR